MGLFQGVLGLKKWWGVGCTNRDEKDDQQPPTAHHTEKGTNTQTHQTSTELERNTNIQTLGDPNTFSGCWRHCYSMSVRRVPREKHLKTSSTPMHVIFRSISPRGITIYTLDWEDGDVRDKARRAAGRA